MNDNVFIGESRQIYDAIVIGSGISGGWAAKELCEKGQKTLMLERGRVVEHRKDYIGENKPPWQQAHRTRVNNLLARQEQQVQAECYAYTDATKHFFGNDKDYPYQHPKGKKFTWIRANQLGGKSLLWHRQSYRWGEHDFQANSLDGYGNEWPVGYKDIASWYSYVEKFAGISGNKDGIEAIPDGEFLPPFEFTAPEVELQKRLRQHFPDRPLIMGRAAHLTKPTQLHISQGRVQCQARNECQAGCSFGAYFSTQSSTLPAAAATNNLHIAPNSVVHSLIYDEKTNRVIGVRVIDNDNLSEREYFAKIVFVCASTIGSTQILLNSVSKKYPSGIGNSSGVLGHYLMDHNYNANGSGTFEGFEDHYYSGRRPSGFIIPNFYFKPEPKRKFLRGYALAGNSYREDWQSMFDEDGIGSQFKDRLRKPGKWKIHLYAQGEMLPRYENQITLHSTLKDKWGIPQLVIDCEYSKNETDMMLEAAAQIEHMLTTCGLTDVVATAEHNAAGLAIHELGTARMGNDPRESYLNKYNQSHDIPNLFVTDGSAFCSSAVQNPSLTFMAFTARAVNYAVKEKVAGRI